MHENIVTGVMLGHHMGIYIALCSAIEDDEASKKQETILDGDVVIINLCGQSRLIVS